VRFVASTLPLLFLFACTSVPRGEEPLRVAAPAAQPAPALASDVEACLDALPGTPVLALPRAHEAISAAAASDEDLTKKTQNPVADLISVPFQNNFNFGVGPGKDLQWVMNVQPVWPFKLNDDWNLITRTILPVMYQPELAPGVGDEFGLGDTLFTGFFSPRKPGGLIWGAGPAILLPTSTDKSLGVGQWGLGPAGVVLKMQGQWVYGALLNNVWSFEGDFNVMTLQPFVNYNLPSGWYIVSAPIVTANWKADGNDTWTVPIGGGAGKIFKIGKLPVNCQAQVFYNVASPDGGAEWQLRIQFQLLFPK
jgi:hypothetical protein